MDLLQFLSAFGLGAILSTAVQAWLSQRAETSKRDFQEKKEAYIGLLDALHQSELQQSHEAAKNVGHWISRVELVGSKKVARLSARILQTNPNGGQVHPERPLVLHDLKASMRDDLGVS